MSRKESVRQRLKKIIEEGEKAWLSIGAREKYIKEMKEIVERLRRYFFIHYNIKMRKWEVWYNALKHFEKSVMEGETIVVIKEGVVKSVEPQYRVTIQVKREQLEDILLLLREHFAGISVESIKFATITPFTTNITFTTTMKLRDIIIAINGLKLNPVEIEKIERHRIRVG